VRALGIITLSPPRVVRAGVDAVAITLLVRGEAVLVVTIIRRVIDARRIQSAAILKFAAAPFVSIAVASTIESTMRIATAASEIVAVSISILITIPIAILVTISVSRAGGIVSAIVVTASISFAVSDESLRPAIGRASGTTT
jgi:hypothetical protein